MSSSVSLTSWFPGLVRAVDDLVKNAVSGELPNELTNGVYEPSDCGRVLAIIRTTNDLINPLVEDHEEERMASTIWAVLETRQFNGNRAYVRAVVELYLVMRVFASLGDWIDDVSNITSVWGSVDIVDIVRQCREHETEIAKWASTV